jgi:plastocyanin
MLLEKEVHLDIERWKFDCTKSATSDVTALTNPLLKGTSAMRLFDRFTDKAALLFFVLAFLAVPPESTMAGEIAGRVDILASSSTAGEAMSPWARTRRIDDAQPQQNSGERIIAVVYFEQDENLPAAEPPDEHPTVDQIEMTIVPHITVIQVGTTVEFPNSDEVYHNLFSLSPTRKFDLGRYGGGQSRSVTFERTGEVQIYCDIHPSMNGVVLVLPNSYFAEVHADGMYQITDIPEGTYRVHAWHETLNESIKTVTVPTQGTVEVNFTLGVN